MNMFFNFAILISLCTPYLPISMNKHSAETYSQDQMISTIEFQLNDDSKTLSTKSLNHRLEFIHDSWDKAKNSSAK